MSEFNGARPRLPDQPDSEAFQRLARIFHEQDDKDLLSAFTREELEALSYIAGQRVEMAIEAFTLSKVEFELRDVLVACYGDAFHAGRVYEREMNQA